MTPFGSGDKYRDNQKARTTTLSGTKNLEMIITWAYQEIAHRTTLEMDMTNARDWSNSLLPSIPAMIRPWVLWCTRIWAEILGTQDRGNIKITKLDIENSQYTSVENRGQSGRCPKGVLGSRPASERVKVEERMTEQAKKLYDLHSEK